VNFSLLMSIYSKERPEHFDRCMRSIWNEQRVQPSQIVLVEDGKLSIELYDTIDKWEKELNGVLHRLPLEKNSGLGESLSAGLSQCSYDLVARMDTDDVAFSNRFQKQIDYLHDHTEVDIVGGWICEFDVDENVCQRIRRVPQKHDEIVKFAKFRNPMNHMTVMFRKSAVERAGSYRPMPGFEDYDLWIRMLQNGSRLANIPEVLLRARTGEGMIERRRGWRYVRQEWHFARAAYQTGFWSFPLAMRNAMLRSAIRLLPAGLLGSMYNFLRKKRT